MDAVTICNRALSRIGHTEVIENLEEDTTLEAEQCNLHFGPCRDATLEDFAWKFATKRVALAELAGVERTDWTYVYSAPADMVVPRFIVKPGDRNPAASDRIDFDVEANDAGDGQLILTDQEDAELLYTMRHEEVEVWTPSFVEAITWRLAIDLALGLKKDAGLAERMEKKYRGELVTAAVSNARQAQKTKPTTPSIAARR